MAFNLLNLKRRFGTKMEEDLTARLSEKTLTRLSGTGPMITGSTPVPDSPGMYSSTGRPSATVWNPGVRTIDDSFTMPGKATTFTREDFEREYMTTWPPSIDAAKISAGTITSTTKVTAGTGDAGTVTAAEMLKKMQDAEAEMKRSLALQRHDALRQRLHDTICHVARKAPQFLDRAATTRISEYTTIGRQLGPASRLKEDLIGVCHKLEFRKPADCHHMSYVSTVEHMVDNWTVELQAEVCALVDAHTEAGRAQAEKLAALQLAESRQADFEEVARQLLEEVEIEEFSSRGDW